MDTREQLQLSHEKAQLPDTGVDEEVDVCDQLRCSDVGQEADGRDQLHWDVVTCAWWQLADLLSELVRKSNRMHC
eukprot:11366822-Karenia_brevis.AAC.1